MIFGIPYSEVKKKMTKKKKSEAAIAKEFATHISKRLKRDMMYAIKKSNHVYEPGQSDIDLFLCPHEGKLSPYFYVWMLVEGILKYGTCEHRNKKTGKIATAPLIDVVLFIGGNAEEECRKAMFDTGNYKVIKYKA